jgi:lysyl-tRNA synthetase class 2
MERDDFLLFSAPPRDEREVLGSKRRFLETRCRVLQLIRAFFESEGFLEVQTPLITATPAPEVHIRPVPAGPGRYLTTSPELHMKRLLASGFEKIFQITRAFRWGERGRLHHPEFTILEWYRSGADYKDLQRDCQNLVRFTCRAIERRGLNSLTWRRGERREETYPQSSVLSPQRRVHVCAMSQPDWPAPDPRSPVLDFKGRWERYSVREAFKKFAGWDPGPDPNQHRFDIDMVEKVQPNLGFPVPCILEDYPKSMAALARIKPEDPDAAERFELFWAGIEIANGFSELTDPVEQRTRFESAIAMKRQIEGIAYPMPEAFLKSLEHLSPCAGIAFGVDRFVMLISGAKTIDDVVAFGPEME